MTNFIYNMQDELFHLPLEDFSTIKKLVDHIEAQGKQLRELNAAITKCNKTIEKYECEKKDLQERNSYLYKKVVELNNGIRNSEDLTWKQKYEALLHSSEQAIGALQKKCQDYKNSESDAITSTIKTLVKENEELKESNERLEKRGDELARQCDNVYLENKKLERSNLDLGDTIGLYVEDFKKLKAENNNLLEVKKFIEKRCREAEKALEDEKQVNKDLNVIINSKNKLLDEYMTKCNNLEHNYKEEVKMKEQFKTICFRHERTIESQNSTIKYLKGKVADYVRFDNGQNDEIKKLKYDNDTLRGRAKEISDLAETIVELCTEEE